MSNGRFQPGQSGNLAGRPKKLLRRVEEELHSMGFSPVQELIALLPDLKPDTKAKVWLELMSYCHAKPKEVAIEADPYVNLTDEEIIKLLREKVPQLKEAS